MVANKSNPVKQADDDFSASLRVAYFLGDFPKLSETFILKEISALRDKGVDVFIFALHKNCEDTTSTHALTQIYKARYFYKDITLKHLALNFDYLLKYPVRYLRLLLKVVHGEYSKWEEIRYLTLKNKIGLIVRLFAFIDLVRTIRIQHMHAHFAWFNVTIAFLVSEFTNIPVTFTTHAADLYAQPQNLVEKIQKAKCVVTVSNYNKDFLTRLSRNGTRAKIKVVHIGVEEDLFDSDRRANNEFTILSVSRLVEKKGLIYLIEACKILRDKGRRFRCVIVGEGKERDRLEKRIKSYNLNDRVKLVGALDYSELLFDFYRQANLFVLPSLVAGNGDRDGIPSSLMEAMAIGIPTISTAVSGIPELIKDGWTGFLVSQKNGRELAGKIKFLMDAPELMKEIGIRGKDFVKEHFSITKSADLLKQIFEEVIL